MRSGLPTLGLGRAESRVTDLANRLDKLASFEDAFARTSRDLDDIEIRVQRINMLSKKWGETLGGAARAGREIAKQIRDQNNALQRANNILKDRQNHLNKLGARTIQNAEEWDYYNDKVEESQATVKALSEDLKLLSKRSENFKKSWTGTKLIMSDVAKMFDKLGKTMTLGGIAAFGAGLYKLEDALQRVYELHERWTNAIGRFRLGIGAASGSVEKWTKMANGMEGQLRSITGQFGLSHEELQTFVRTFGFADDRAASFAKNSVLMGRALGIGTEGAAGLARNLALMGEEVGGQTDLFGKIVAGADAAGVSTADFGKELANSRESLAAFGLKAQGVFVRSAGFARSLGLSVKSFESFIKSTDQFDSTVESMARLNTVFGTSLNALSMVMEEDPSKRLEEVRQQLKLQGKDLETLSRQEKIFLAQTLQISQEELNGVISSKTTLEEYQKKEANFQKTRKQNEIFFQRALAKTQQTLYAFSLGWDTLTKSIENLIHPFTDLLGLTSQTKTFGGVMKTIFERVAHFIDEIAANPDWQKFIHKMADEFEAMAKNLSDFATGPRLGKFIETVTEGGTKFYNLMKATFKLAYMAVEKLMPLAELLIKHIDVISGAWMAGKVGSALIGAGTGLVSTIKMLREIQKMKANMPSAGVPSSPGLGSRAWGAVKSVGSGIAGAAKSVGGGIWNAAKWGAGMIGKGGAAAATAIGAAVTGLGKAASSAASAVGSFASSIASRMGPIMAGLGASFVSFGQYLTGPLSSAMSTVAGKLGAAGLVVAAGAAGYALGRFIGNLEVGGKKIDDWVVLGYEKISDFFSGLWKAFKESSLGQFLGMNDTTADLQKKMGMNDVALGAIERAFSRVQSGNTNQKDLSFLAESAKVQGQSLIEYLAKKRGITEAEVNRVISLAPTATAVSPVPANAMPATAAAPSGPQNLVRPKAAGQNSGGTAIAGDVYLDGNKVGQHLLRGWMQGAQ